MMIPTTTRSRGPKPKRPRGQGLALSGIAQRSPTLERRFWAKVDKRGPGECWPWTGAKASTGYGDIYYGVTPDKRYITVSGHTASWLLHGHTLPIWPMVLDHICNDRGCVNPAHLRVVSQGTNSRENNGSPFAHHARKTHCSKGHPFSVENIAIVKRPPKIQANGWRVGTTTARVCLTCFPNYWRHAAIPRPRPPGSRIKPGDPDYQESSRYSEQEKR